MRVLLLLGALGGGPAHAQSAGSEPIEQDAGQGIPGLPPGPVPPPAEVDAIAHRTALRLRCPVCQGLSVADSTSPAAVNFQRRIHELVGMGYSQGQIEDYFVDRYGEFILLDPPARGLNWLLWVAPAVAAGAGLTWSMVTAAQWRKEPDEVPLPSDVGLIRKDKYEEALLAELDD